MKARRIIGPALLALATVIGSARPAAAQPAGSLDEAMALLQAGRAADQKGDYLRAEAAIARASAMLERGLGPDHPQVGAAKSSLCNVYEHMGDYARAEPLCEAAVDNAERAFGPRDVRLAVIVSNYALVSAELGRFDQAELLYSRALDIYGGAGPTTREIPNALHNLGSLYYQANDYARAEPLFLKSLKAAERILGADHPETANALNSLGILYADMGKLDQAEASLLRAIAVLEKRLGPDHPHLAASHLNLGGIYLRLGAIPKAIAAHSRGAEIEEKSLALVLAGGSEAQKRTFLGTMRSETDGIVSLHAVAAPKDASAARLSLLTVLRRKGRVLDAMAQGIAALRGRLGDADRATLDQLGGKRAELAALVLGASSASPEQRAQQAALEADAQRLEAAIGARSAEYRAAAAPVTIESVAAAIPDGAALVEIVAYRPVSFSKAAAKGFQPAHYLAYVLDHRGDVRWAELGPAAAIDASVTTLRRALAAKSPGAQAAARDLDKLVMEPIRGVLGGAEMVLLSPDGSLNLVPFAALVDEGGRFLVERFAFDYLTSGRDLLRQSAHGAPRGPAMIVAAPDFGPPSATRGGGGLAGATFNALPGTADEARALGGLLAGSTIVTGAEATATALTQIHAPRILHVATHGFFLPDVGPEPKPTAKPAAADQRGFDLEERARIENPLLRSGLVLAGANLHGRGKDAGIFTALEASGLDLFGTRLVVLSACETGLGDVQNGDGVYGLRRALVIAGAETQVMSLWKVDDAATRDLMIAYYKALESGGERGASMRGVQRAMLGATATAHPFYWASFIVSGDPSSLDGKLVPPAPRADSKPAGQLDPGPRGCGCELSASAPGTEPWILLLAGLGLVTRAARARRPSRNRSVTSS